MGTKRPTEEQTGGKALWPQQALRAAERSTTSLGYTPSIKFQALP